MTYNVFGGTLNLALFILVVASLVVSSSTFDCVIKIHFKSTYCVSGGTLAQLI